MKQFVVTNRTANLTQYVERCAPSPARLSCRVTHHQTWARDETGALIVDITQPTRYWLTVYRGQEELRTWRLDRPSSTSPEPLSTVMVATAVTAALVGLRPADKDEAINGGQLW